MISVNNVTKWFGEQEVLSDIFVRLDSGKIYGLVGRNGCGKTMLMKCICGFVKPTSGKIVINGNVLGKDMDVPEHMGIIIENPGFIPYYSGYKNLRLLASVRGKTGKKEIAEYMEMVGLDAKSKKHVSKYSLGMRQKLGIVQAIMERPEILLLDEPMNGLDRKSVELVRNLIKKTADAGAVVLLSSHNQEDIDTLCDVVYHMEDGRIIV
jgi:ABC-type multidrug transport system, ATPase component